MRFFCSGFALFQLCPMASALIEAKLKCGSTLASISSISRARLPALISLSLEIRSTTSSVTRFTSTSGPSCAGAGAPHAAAKTNSSALASLAVIRFLRWPLSGRLAVVDQAAAPLQVGVALEHVPVERRLLEDADRVEQVGARLRQAQPDKPVLQMIGPHLGERVGIEIDPLAEAVAHRARAQQGKYEVRPAFRAPPAEGLAEVLVVLLVAHLARHVVDAEKAEARVPQHSRPVPGAVGELALQDVVRADEHVADVAEEIAHAVANLTWHDPLVAARHRLRDVHVDYVVEAVDAPVHALERVARVALARAGAAGDERGDHDPAPHFAASFASPLPSAALLNRNWLIRFSSTTADWARRSRSPFLSITPSPPASRPTYCSPRMPEVRILAVVSRGNW